jgi:hypothetical protein
MPSAQEIERSVWQNGWIQTHAIPTILFMLTGIAYLLEPVVLQAYLEHRVTTAQLNEDALQQAESDTFQDLFWDAGADLHAALKSDHALYVALWLPIYLTQTYTNLVVMVKLCYYDYRWSIAPKALLLLSFSFVINLMVLSPLPYDMVQYESVGVATCFSLVVTKAHVTFTPRLGITLLALYERGITLFGTQPTMDIACLKRGLAELVWIVCASALVLSCHQMHTQAWVISLTMVIVTHVTVNWLQQIWLAFWAHRSVFTETRAKHTPHNKRRSQEEEDEVVVEMDTELSRVPTHTLVDPGDMEANTDSEEEQPSKLP